MHKNSIHPSQRDNEYLVALTSSSVFYMPTYLYIAEHILLQSVLTHLKQCLLCTCLHLYNFMHVCQHDLSFVHTNFKWMSQLIVENRFDGNRSNVIWTHTSGDLFRFSQLANLEIIYNDTDCCHVRDKSRHLNDTVLCRIKIRNFESYILCCYVAYLSGVSIDWTFLYRYWIWDKWIFS